MTKLKNNYPPAVSVVTFSADVATLYREQRDPEKLEDFEEELSADFDENSGFAIIINGHSLIHCLSPELEARFVAVLNVHLTNSFPKKDSKNFISDFIHTDLSKSHLNARL